MNQRIIYKTEDDRVAIIIPAVSTELAIKDIPQGKPFKIIDASEIPSDRTFRNAWEYQE
jgi:hypothetical protein